MHGARRGDFRLPQENRSWKLVIYISIPFKLSHLADYEELTIRVVGVPGPERETATPGEHRRERKDAYEEDSPIRAHVGSDR